MTNTLQVRTLIGGNGGAGPSSLHITLEGPKEYVHTRIDIDVVESEEHIEDEWSKTLRPARRSGGAMAE